MNLAETTASDLTGVPETLLITLYVRAMESQRPDALVKDERAEELVARLGYDFSQIQQIHMDEADQAALILRSREFDRCAGDFLARHPDAVVVHIGCGLDSRFERVDNGTVDWYDLDVPDVIALREKLLGSAGPRNHHLACSAFDMTWLDQVRTHKPRPFLFLAEGVFMYFLEEQVRRLVRSLHEQLPGSELVFDAFSPYLVRMNNLRFSLTHYGARYHWGLSRGRDLERWGAGIRLLGEWSYFDRPEPRLARVHWMRHIPFFAKVLCIYRYQLAGISL